MMDLVVEKGWLRLGLSALSLMHPVIGQIRHTMQNIVRKATLAYRYASLAALRYSLACRNFEKMPGFESNPTFISLALPNVSSDALQELTGDILQGNSLFDGVVVTF
jgi:hypothetical protein